MKTTKVGEKWSPEYWQASGSIGIELSGLDLTGTATAAFYRAGTNVDFIAEEADLSANIQVEETYDRDTIFAKGLFEADAGSIFSGSIELLSMKVTKDGNSWSPEYWSAKADLQLRHRWTGTKVNCLCRLLPFRI